MSFPQLVELKTSTFIIGGLSLVASLAWDNVVNRSIDKYYPGGSKTLTASVIYAIVLTLIVVLFIYLEAKYFPKIAKESDAEWGMIIKGEGFSPGKEQFSLPRSPLDQVIWRRNKAC